MEVQATLGKGGGEGGEGWMISSCPPSSFAYQISLKPHEAWPARGGPLELAATLP